MPTMSMDAELAHIKTRQAKLKEEERKLEERRQKAEARVAARDRKLDTGRKVVAGALLLTDAESDDQAKQYLLRLLRQPTTRDRDRLKFPDLLDAAEIEAAEQRIAADRARRAEERAARQHQVEDTYTPPPRDPQAAAIFGGAAAPEPAAEPDLEPPPGPQLHPYRPDPETELQ